MFRDTFRIINKAARSAILLVHDRRADVRHIHAHPARLDKTLLIDASVLITLCGEHATPPLRDRSREKLRAELARFLSSKRSAAHRCEPLLHHFDDEPVSQRGEWAPACSASYGISPCDAEPIDRALVWHQPELVSTMNWWIEKDQRPRTAGPRHRYLLLGQAGGEGERREYLVFVQSALVSEHEPHRGWIEQREPSVLKFRDHFYCQSFETSIKAEAERKRRELLMCVVPLAPSDEKEPSPHKAALDQITAFILGEVAPAADASEDPAGGDAEPDTAWLSLNRYADIFLGEGARKRILDAHLGSKRAPAGKRQVDPDTA